MSTGGVLGGFVMCQFPNGTSWKYRKETATTSEETKVADKKKEGSNKSPMAKVKEPIAKFFAIPIVVPAEMLKASLRTKNLTVNGMTHKTVSAVKMGATGRSRSVTVKFKSLQTIGKKKVASVRVTMPYSYTMKDMITFIMQSQRANTVAAIVSDKGNSWTFGTAYNPKAKKGA
jgi:hypothetical protein